MKKTTRPAMVKDGLGALLLNCSCVQMGCWTEGKDSSHSVSELKSNRLYHISARGQKRAQRLYESNVSFLFSGEVIF